MLSAKRTGLEIVKSRADVAGRQEFMKLALIFSIRFVWNGYEDRDGGARAARPTISRAAGVEQYLESPGGVG